MRQYALYIIILTVLLSSCSCGTGKKRADSPGAEETGVCSALELPLPDVPEEMTDHVERADFVMAHFWDGMNFSDTLRSHDTVFMERNVVNFMSLFSHGSERGCSQGICELLDKAVTDSSAFGIVSDIMERYLNDPNSPMRNEGHYILYLEARLKVPGLQQEDRFRTSYRLTTARKNRPGTPAADFVYLDRDGKRHSLRTTAPGQPLLLLFYDPECDHCSQILAQVRKSSIIRERMERGELTVLAVYTEGNRKLWNKTKDSMPRRWIVGCDMDSIVAREVYDIPAMPVMYLLDGVRRVILKDATLPAIEAGLQ